MSDTVNSSKQTSVLLKSQCWEGLGWGQCPVGSWERKLFFSCFLWGRFQPGWPSWSSKGQIQTIAHQRRSSQEPTWVKTQFSGSVLPYSLRPHGLQHTRLPCPSPNPGACSNSRPLSWWGTIQPSHPLSSPSPPAFNLAQHQGLPLRIRWPEDWSFSFSISPSHEYAGLISFRMDWLDLLAVQGTLKSLLQHHSSKVSILWCSAFFIVQPSHLYMTTGKTISLN